MIGAPTRQGWPSIIQPAKGTSARGSLLHATLVNSVSVGEAHRDVGIAPNPLDSVQHRSLTIENEV